MLAGAIFAFLALPISLGVNLILEVLITGARSFLGIGVVLAIIGILTTNRINAGWKISFAFPSMILLYSFITFALAFGNGLADQERYGNFRVESVLNDLSRIYTTKEEVDKTSLQIINSVGDSAVMKHIRDEYPVVNQIMRYPWYGGMGYGSWIGYLKPISYYNRPQNFVIATKTTKFDCDSMKTRIDTYYHTIKDNDKGEVCVILK
jgi:hypothetical protein